MRMRVSAIVVATMVSGAGCSSAPEGGAAPAPVGPRVEDLRGGFESLSGIRLGTKQGADWHTIGKFITNAFAANSLTELFDPSSARSKLTPTTPLMVEGEGELLYVVARREAERITALAAVLPGQDWSGADFQARLGLQVGGVVWAEDDTVLFATDDPRSFVFYEDPYSSSPCWAVIRTEADEALGETVRRPTRPVDRGALGAALGRLDGAEGWIAERLVADGAGALGLAVGARLPFSASLSATGRFDDEVASRLTGVSITPDKHLLVMASREEGRGLHDLKVFVREEGERAIVTRLVVFARGLTARAEAAGLVYPEGGVMTGRQTAQLAQLSRPGVWWSWESGDDMLIFVTPEEDAAFRERPSITPKWIANWAEQGDITELNAMLESLPGGAPEALVEAAKGELEGRREELLAVARGSIVGRLSVALRAARGELGAMELGEVKDALSEERLTQASVDALMRAAAAAVEDGRWGTALGCLAVTRWPRAEGVEAPPVEAVRALARRAAGPALVALAKRRPWTAADDPCFDACRAAIAEKVAAPWREWLTDPVVVAELFGRGELSPCFATELSDWEGELTLGATPGTRKRRVTRRFVDPEAKAAVDAYERAVAKWKGVVPCTRDLKTYRALRNFNTSVGAADPLTGRVKSITYTFEDPVGSPEFEGESRCERWIEENREKECRRPSDRVMEAGTEGVRDTREVDDPGIAVVWASTLTRRARLRWVGEESSRSAATFRVDTPPGEALWFFFDDELPKHLEDEAKLRRWLTEDPKRDLPAQVVKAVWEARSESYTTNLERFEGATRADIEERAWREQLARSSLEEDEKDAIWILSDTLRHLDLAPVR